MGLDIRTAGRAHVTYLSGHVDIPKGIDGDYNWTKLQAVLRWSLAGVTPTIISLSEASTNDPGEPGLRLTINFKQEWSGKLDRPLTICTAHTVIGEGNPSIRLLMRTSDGPAKCLLGDPLFGVWMRHVEPDTNDWKTALPFTSIPPGAQGLTVTKTIPSDQLLRYRGKSSKLPQPGDEYMLAFARGRQESFIDWWNWGDLEGDLKDRKFVDLVDPKLNGVQNPVPPSPPALLSFDAWSEDEDEDGHEYVRLLNVLDTSPLVVRFVE